MDDLEYSISFTTRAPRTGEMEGVDYRFIERDRFLAMRNQGLFLEWAEVHGNLYGTLREDIEKSIGKGRDTVLEIDVQGALNVKAKMPEAILIFIMPPSPMDLEKRLKKRGTEKENDLRVRLDDARREMCLSDKYDHSVVNDDLESALESLQKIIASYRFR